MKHQNKMRFMLIGIFLLLLTRGNFAFGQDNKLFNVGYQILDIKYQDDDCKPETLSVALWYPTAEKPHTYDYGGTAKGCVAFGAKPLEGAAYPFLLFSHGYGGCGTGSVFFTETLAAHGWIVACPDHHDEYSLVRIRKTGEKLKRLAFILSAKKISSSGPEDRHKYLYRLREMDVAFRGLMETELFTKLIDKNRIAAGGHSFGGFTALGISGTIKEFHNPLIKGVLLFSTGAGSYLFTDSELASVRIPSMLFMGKLEEKQKRGNKTMLELSSRLFNAMASPKYFLEIKGANHFSFNNNLTDPLGIMPLCGTEKQFEIIRRYSIAFLEKYIAGKQNEGSILNQSDSMLASYLMDPLSNER